MLRVPLQRLFYLEWGEFKGIFLADWSGHNEIENLIKMSKVDFEKQIFEKKFFWDLGIFFWMSDRGDPCWKFFHFSKKKISKFYFSKSTFDIFIRFSISLLILKLFVFDTISKLVVTLLSILPYSNEKTNFLTSINNPNNTITQWGNSVKNDRKLKKMGIRKSGFFSQSIRTKLSEHSHCA